LIEFGTIAAFPTLGERRHHGERTSAAQRHDYGATAAHPLFRYSSVRIETGQTADVPIDGGGVRGYSLLILLREFMHQTYVATHGAEGDGPQNGDPRPKPCDYFDLIAGTGTGGLIAIMLGRLRMDLVECMEVYVRMTRKVFETDKTIAGIPYRSTLFKASKLEDAIKECVREYEQEKVSDASTPASPGRPPSVYSAQGSFHRRSMTSGTYSPMRPFGSGNPNAYLYDTRENRTKT
jgi:hypothetical protein